MEIREVPDISSLSRTPSRLFPDKRALCGVGTDLLSCWVFSHLGLFLPIEIVGKVCGEVIEFVKTEALLKLQVET